MTRTCNPNPTLRTPESKGKSCEARSSRSGFTLLELVVAIAIIGGSFLALLEIRGAAEERAVEYNETRLIRRLAQQKLDEVVYELETNTQGSWDDHQYYDWVVDAIPLGSGEGPETLEVTITVTYPTTGDQDVGEYTLTTWFFPDEEHPLLQLSGSSSDLDERRR